MAKKAPTAEELLAELDNFDAPSTKTPSASTPSRPLKKAPTNHADPLADLEELESLAKAKPSSRPSTPRLASNLPSRAANRSPVRRSGEERKSAESVTSTTTGGGGQGFTPTSETEESVPLAQAAQGGGWWGGILATASAAVKQAETAVKELQKNEEAQKWADSVRGNLNVGALRGLSEFALH
jgi:hypothetical protein